jgi:hypothetical protein
MRFSLFFSALIILPLTLLPALGQNRSDSQIPTLGYEFGVPLSLERTPGVINRFGAGGSGRAVQHTLRLGDANAWSGHIVGDLDAQIWVGLTGSFGSFSSTPFISSVDIPPGTGPVTRTFDVRTVEMHALADIRLRYRIAPAWTVGLGPWFSYRLFDQLTETEQIVAPANATFINGQRSQNISSGSELSDARTEYGLIAAIGVSMHTGPALTVEPRLFARLDAGSIDLGARAFSLGLDVGFSFAGDDTSIALPDDSVRSTPDAIVPIARSGPVEAPVLRASIALFAVDSAGVRSRTAVIRSRRITQRHAVEVPPVIFFDRDSVHLAPRYRRLAPEETFRFAADSVRLLDLQHAYYHLLNLLGARLRSDPSTRLLLSSMPAPGEPEELAALRIAAIGSYLHDVWSIDRARIARAPLPDDSSSRRALGALRLSGPGLLAAIVRGEMRDDAGTTILSEEHIRQFEGPQLGIEPAIDAEAGVRSWSVTVRFGDSVIARRGSNGVGEGTGALLIDVAGDTSDATIGPVTARIDVEDSTGARTSARGLLPVQIARESREDEAGTGAAGLRSTWTVVPPSPVSVAALDAEPWLDTFVRSLGHGSRVTIAGRYDRVDVATMVRALSRLLAARGLGDVAIDAVDRPAAPLWYPDEPDGRLLAGAVEITVE